MSEYADSEFKIIRGIVICKLSGEPLVDNLLDTNINPVMISSFVSALSMFGKENIGKIEETGSRVLPLQ